ncbi:LCP family protein [Nocardioides sp.]|uniref:LCP family protein n=1 Tax=Nocardioides sp. TaxID=35761 RepID=UPI002ED0EC49
MKRTTIIGLISVPLAIAGLYWLMLHGYLELSAYLLAAAVLAMLVGTFWEWRHGRRRWAALLLVGAVATAATVGWYGWHLNAKLDNIQRVTDDVLGKGERPPAPEEPTEALTILLMGSDDPNRAVEKPTVAELLESGEWNVGAYRSDTMMVVHVPADRSAAYVVSVPRDSYVEIFDDEGEPRGRNKINAAFAQYGPFGTWRTIENLSDLRLDHMAIIDFEGFRDLTTAIGGVDVYVPERVVDTKTGTTWEKGWVHLEDELALKYVRMRYGLTEGDFDRVDRQQNFLRAVMDKVLADDTMGNPVRFSDTLSAVTKNLTVDESWSNGALRSLAFSLRGLDQEKVRFMTLPFSHYDEVPDAGSVNIIDEERAAELWKAMAQDRIGAYLEKHPDDELPAPRQVS